jgi:hypothetical protein
LIKKEIEIIPEDVKDVENCVKNGETVSVDKIIIFKINNDETPDSNILAISDDNYLTIA